MTKEELFEKIKSLSPFIEDVDFCEPLEDTPDGLIIVESDGGNSNGPQVYFDVYTFYPSTREYVPYYILPETYSFHGNDLTDQTPKMCYAPHTMVMLLEIGEYYLEYISDWRNKLLAKLKKEVD